MSMHRLPPHHSAILCLALVVSACGGGSSATATRDASHEVADDAREAGRDVPGGAAEVSRDVASDQPMQAETSAGAAEVPLSPDRDAAFVDDAVVLDVARSDGDGLDGNVDRFGVDGGAAEAADDGPTGRADLNKLDSAADLAADPVCGGADSDGFFSSCSSCANPGNCDSVTVGGQTRRACGCESDSDCPCGFACGCVAIAPSINMCGVCKR